MGLDITFFKTKRNDFIDGEKNIYDNNGNNKFGDKTIYYLRKNNDVFSYLHNKYKSKYNGNINETIIEIDNSDIIEISKLIDDDLFIDKLTTPLNKGYIIYVECNY